MTAYERIQASFSAAMSGLAGEDSPTVLVGFSGGADSSLLLHLMHKAGYSLVAAHLNHGIRGQEATEDEAFCRRTCQTLNIPFFSQYIDVPSLARDNGLGLEEMARKARYDYLQEVAKEQGCSLIATAHHADDNLETILFHLVRGSALKGLCGIPMRRDNIIRPLLNCSRDDILAACREQGIAFVTDASNQDSTYSRNYLRNEVIPLLKRMNPKLSESVATTARLLSLDEDELATLASRYSLSDGRDQLISLPDAILSRVLICEMRARGLSPSHMHIHCTLTALRSPQTRVQVSIPGGMLSVDRNTVTVISEPAPTAAFDVPLTPGLNVLSGYDAVYIDFNGDNEKDINTLKNIYKFAIKASLDSATINEALRARSRRPGDTYRYGGMTRSVKKLLQSKKTTLSERSRLPMIVAVDELLWIPGFPPADAAKPKDAASEAVIYYLHKT